MILILTDTVTPRLEYISEFIFKENFGSEYFITTDENDFTQTKSIRINFTESVFTGNVINMPAVSLLFETNVYKQDIATFEINGLLAFFRNETSSGNFPFDIFSAIFYLLTRYEEYLPHSTDKYGRYDHHQSLATEKAFLKIPLINKWLRVFADFIQNKFPGFKATEPSFTFLPTFDIDIAFEWQHKGLIKNAAHLLRLLLHQDYENISKGLKVLSGKEKDPFNSFDFIDQLNDQYELRPLYFFLVALKNSRLDKNISPYHNHMRRLIQRYAKDYHVGIHPSFYSSEDETSLKKEKFALEEITGNIIKKSRQHYLRFNLPRTYRQLAAAGIQDEYSMGYGTVNGFRASYAGTFYWYDLEREEQTKLRIHPFCYMDSNAIFHEKLSPQEALSELLFLYNECKNINGTFVSVFHNHLMTSNDPQWADVYKKFLAHINQIS